MNYHSAMERLKTARNVENGKPIDRNTRLMLRTNDSVAVKLHRTDVVTFHANGDVTLNSGGWKTMTTKDRMNNTSPYPVWSERGTWYVSVNGKHVPFEDGITIHTNGTVTGAGDEDVGNIERKLRESVKQYAIGFVDALYRGQVMKPSAADCMICSGSFPNADQGEHIKSHIAESYYVPSLLTNALMQCGASKVAHHDAWAMMYDAPIETLADALAYVNIDRFSKRGDFIAKQIEKCIRKYTLRQLGVAV